MGIGLVLFKHLVCSGFFSCQRKSFFFFGCTLLLSEVQKRSKGKLRVFSIRNLHEHVKVRRFFQTLMFPLFCLSDLSCFDQLCNDLKFQKSFSSSTCCHPPFACALSNCSCVSNTSSTSACSCPSSTNGPTKRVHLLFYRPHFHKNLIYLFFA